jgi:hypothetical protein
MKKLLSIVLVIITNNLIAQKTKLDNIIKNDYAILEVNIIKISDSEVEFTFPNETLKINLSIAEVAKIIFRNGRVQEFNNEDNLGFEIQQNNEENKIDVQERQALLKNKVTIKENTIAILPIPFVNTETLASSSEMAKFAQNDLYSKLIENSANLFPLTSQDLRETNSLLKKAGIDYSNIDEVLIEDLQNILGVDHIIASKVSYVITVNETNMGYGNTTLKKKSDTKSKVDDFSISTTSENKKFDFTVYFDIYKNGTKVFTQTRQPFFNQKDSWKDSIEYLLKRCPIYKKK